jgi:transcriptional regulator with XRE-family HTH domain
VAEELRVAMVRRKVTAAHVARIAGISTGAMSERLNGKRSFNTDQLAAIADALDLDIADLFPADAIAS